MAEFEHQPGDFVLLRQLFQHILSGGNSLALPPAGRRGQTQMGKQHLAELLGRVDVEPPPRQLKDALAHPLKLEAESRRKAV